MAGEGDEGLDEDVWAWWDEDEEKVLEVDLDDWRPDTCAWIVGFALMGWGIVGFVVWVLWGVW